MSNPRRPSVDELAAGPIDEQDVDALARMAAMYNALDPVPAGLVDRIQFGITLDALHAEIAELQRGGDLVGVRSGVDGDVQTITFTSAALTTMVTIVPTSADRVRIDGWIAPGGGIAVELRGEDATRQTVADADGRFVFDDVPHGLAQFVLRPVDNGSSGPVVTPSIEV
ncbi:MAG TPA: hypothetical protein VKB75_03245 [Jatrophihabitans sp.]|nr:hypothetical protein [Jatrophihabitans sp.]